MSVASATYLKKQNIGESGDFGNIQMDQAKTLDEWYVSNEVVRLICLNHKGNYAIFNVGRMSLLSS
jgi:hypothetical protein